MNKAKKLKTGDAVGIGLPIGVGFGVGQVLREAIEGPWGIVVGVVTAGVVAGLTGLALQKRKGHDEAR